MPNEATAPRGGRRATSGCLAGFVGHGRGPSRPQQSAVGLIRPCAEISRGRRCARGSRHVRHEAGAPRYRLLRWLTRQGCASQPPQQKRVVNCLVRPVPNHPSPPSIGREQGPFWRCRSGRSGPVGAAGLCPEGPRTPLPRARSSLWPWQYAADACLLVHTVLLQHPLEMSIAPVKCPTN